VHRLVRILLSIRQTASPSFQSVFVSPEIDESIEVVIKPRNIASTYRSERKGGIT